MALAVRSPQLRPMSETARSEYLAGKARDFIRANPLRALQLVVIKIARTHPDEYIRHRVEVQLHRSPSAYPLPPRKRAGTQVLGRKSGWWKQLWK